MEISTAVGTIKIENDMIVDIDDWIPEGEYNPHSVRPWAIGDQFGTIAVAFADSGAAAIDAAIDAGKLDGRQIHDHECADDCEALHGGNAGEAFDQSYLWIVELPNPRMDWPTLLEKEVHG